MYRIRIQYSISATFWGAIEDLVTSESGVLFARSGYKWHCFDNGNVTNLLKNDGADLSKEAHLECITRSAEDPGYCWSIKADSTLMSRNSVERCKIGIVSHISSMVSKLYF